MVYSVIYFRRIQHIMMLLVFIIVVFLGDTFGENAVEECVYAPTYNGTVNVTKDGIPCQRWDSQVPHRHTRNRDVNFPNDGSASNAHNYCRDPDGVHDMWCYTTDPNVRYQMCDINKCKSPKISRSDCDVSLPLSENSRHCPQGTVYYICEIGPLLVPRSIEYHFPCEHYYCCNPNKNKVTSKATSIMYKQSSLTSEIVLVDANNTTDLSRKHSMHEPETAATKHLVTPTLPIVYHMSSKGNTHVTTNWVTVSKSGFIKPECVHAPTYNGTVNVTKDGIPCQRWDSQVPHKHNKDKDVNFPNDASVSDAHNYCRDIDGKYELWCFTTNPKVRYQKCGITICAIPEISQNECRDQLPEGKTSRDCPEETVYYFCMRGLMSVLSSIEYNFECDFYFCCNSSMKTSRNPLTTSEFDNTDPHNSNLTEHHITTEMTSSNTDVTYNEAFGYETPNGSNKIYRQFTLNDIIFFVLLFIYKRIR